jgi:hypothetical protein
MKSTKPSKNRRRAWTSKREHERDNIPHPELFSVPHHSHLLMTKERRTGEERSLVGKYLELADIALSKSFENDAFSPTERADKKERYRSLARLVVLDPQKDNV